MLAIIIIVTCRDHNGFLVKAPPPHRDIIESQRD